MHVVINLEEYDNAKIKAEIDMRERSCVLGRIQAMESNTYNRFPLCSGALAVSPEGFRRKYLILSLFSGPFTWPGLDAIDQKRTSKEQMRSSRMTNDRKNDCEPVQPDRVD